MELYCRSQKVSFLHYLMNETSLIDIPNSRRVFYSTSFRTESKVFLKSVITGYTAPLHFHLSPVSHQRLSSLTLRNATVVRTRLPLLKIIHQIYKPCNLIRTEQCTEKGNRDQNSVYNNILNLSMLHLQLLDLSTQPRYNHRKLGTKKM